MGVHLRHFQDYRLSLGVVCGAVAGDDMLRLFESFDKAAKWLVVFGEDVDLAGLDIAHIPAMKRAVTPDPSEPEGGEFELTAFVTLGGGGEFFTRFWMHYAALGVRRSRKRDVFPTIAAACQWLGLPPPATETLAAAVADAIGSETGATASEAERSQTRRRIVKVASRMFREHGFDGVTEAEIMEAAGLPGRGLEGYFGSREDLIFHAMVEAIVTFKPPEELAAFACYYLSAEHRADVGGGCPVAALASETFRQSPEARAAMTTDLNIGIERLSRSAPGGDASARRRAAIRACSAMVGSLILARMSDDEELAQELVNESLSWVEERRERPEVSARAD